MRGENQGSVGLLSFEFGFRVQGYMGVLEGGGRN